MLGFRVNTERIVYEMCFWHDVCHTFIIIQFKIYPNFQCDCLFFFFLDEQFYSFLKSTCYMKKLLNGWDKRGLKS